MEEKIGSPRRFVFSWVCVVSPFVLGLVLVSLAVHARVALGHWPVPMTENFGTPLYELHERLFIWVGFFALFCAGPVWLTLLAIPRWRGLWRFHGLQAGIYLAGWALLFLYCAVDPGRFVAWFLD